MFQSIKNILASKTTERLLNEGVYDPGIFKVIFVVGGPGSGKSWAIENALLRKQKSGFPLKIVNSDVIFEYMMKKSSVHLNIAKMTPEELETKDKIRDIAKGKTNLKQSLLIDGRIGLILDMTGKEYNKVEKQKTKFEELGYDCFMIFVYTDLEVSIGRNNQRARKLDTEFVKKTWNQIQDNRAKFGNLFGRKNFYVLNNSEFVSSEDLNAFTEELWKRIMKFVNKPIENPIAKKWIENELKTRKK